MRSLLYLAIVAMTFACAQEKKLERKDQSSPSESVESPDAGQNQKDEPDLNGPVITVPDGNDDGGQQDEGDEQDPNQSQDPGNSSGVISGRSTWAFGSSEDMRIFFGASAASISVRVGN